MKTTQLRNDPSRKGQLAARKRLFGEYRRYAVAPVHTRFDAVEWFVWDAHELDPVIGGPAIIRQAETEEAAVHGLATETIIDGCSAYPLRCAEDAPSVSASRDISKYEG